MKPREQHLPAPHAGVKKGEIRMTCLTYFPFAYELFTSLLRPVTSSSPIEKNVHKHFGSTNSQMDLQL